METPAKLVRSTESLWRTTPGYLVLSDVEGSTIEVTGPGAAIWHLLAAPIDDATLMDELARIYSTSVSEIRGDVTAVLAALVDRGHVRRVDPRVETRAI